MVVPNYRVFKQYCWITMMKQHQDYWTIILMDMKIYDNTIYHISQHSFIKKMGGCVHNIFVVQNTEEVMVIHKNNGVLKQSCWITTMEQHNGC